ncbi:MAG TPA: hypothetical protein VFE05_15150 [Longimicrobiaceae bacterium]|jgi:hypothetical protein|nr:hypothetical protein [Longimicrobiaceae bacterium]
MHETPTQAPLAPAEEEVRVVLRALLGRLLAMEPERYSPLYVGPLRRAEPVRRALAEALARNGGTLVGAEALWEGGPADAVGLAPLRAAAQILRDGAGRRWVIVGEEDPDQLPPELLARLDEVGLVYDTRQVPAPPARPSPLGLAIAEHAGQGGPWLLRVATEPDAASVVAAEAALRLRVLGYAAGAVWEPGPDGDASSAVIPASERAALVCTLDVPLTPDRAAALVRRAQEQCAALVLVGPASAVASAGAGADCPSTWVRAAPEPVPDTVRSAAWPPAREVLTGAPEPGAERELIAAMGVTHRELNHTVRSAASWERPGYLLVFTPERFGWIAIDGRDGVVGAWRLGEPARARQEADDLLGRVRAMSLWAGSRALFVAATPPLPERGPGPVVLVDTVDLDIRRTLDEAREGRVQPGSLPPDPVGLPPSRIARELLWWGQGRHAQELLQAAERASPWGIEEELLLGYLSAERDPGEAAARLQHAAHRLASDLGGARWGQHVDATLAALLLDVRAHPNRAPHAWGVVDRWIESLGEEWIGTARRAAVVYELAARAGELDRAARFRDLVLRFATPGDELPGWVERSDPLPLAGAAR